MLIKGLSSQICFHENNDKIIILAHGFRGSPDNFTELSKILYNNGYSIYNLRLPGHGLVNKDEILKTKLRDWECYIENIFLDLQDRFKKIYFCGFSLGASLLLNIAIKYPIINKIVIYSPFLKLKKKLPFLSGIIKYLKKKIYSDKIDCSIGGEVFKGFIPFIPIPQVFELYKLSKKVMKIINKINIPVLCFLSKNDNVLNFEELEYELIKKTNFNIITLEKSYHNLIVDIEKDFVIKKTLEWINEK